VHRSARRPYSGEHATALRHPWSVPSSVHGGPSASGRFTTRGPGPHLYPLENNSKINISGNFAKKLPCFFEINPRSSFCRFCTLAPLFFRNQPAIRDFSVRPRNWKNIYKKVPSLRKILKNSSKNFKNSYLFNHNSKSSDSCAKILRITSSFFLCIHITHVCCILLSDCLCFLAIGNVVPEPLFEDLQD
jgi:hypothetical protein